MSVRASVFASNLALRQTGGNRRILGGWLHSVSYALWLGGLIVIGAIVAPNVAIIIHHNPVFADNKELQNELLVTIIGNSFRAFNVVCYACGGLMILSDLLQSVDAEPGYRQFTLARTVITIILLATSVYLGYLLFPAMDHARFVGNMPRFDRLHKLYVLISELQILPLLIIPAITARRDRALDAGY